MFSSSKKAPRRKPGCVQELSDALYFYTNYAQLASS